MIGQRRVDWNWMRQYGAEIYELGSGAGLAGFQPRLYHLLLVIMGHTTWIKKQMKMNSPEVKKPVNVI